MGTVHLRDYNFAAVTGDRPGHQNCFKLCGASDHRVYYFSTSSREVSCYLTSQSLLCIGEAGL